MNKRTNESKAQRQTRVAESLAAKGALPGVPAKETSPATNGKSETPATPATTETAPKAKKKVSATVVAWKKQELPALTAKIHLVKTVESKPKRGKSMDRYAHYKEGMTVGEYIEHMGQVAGGGKALAANDVRWDIAKGLITVQ